MVAGERDLLRAEYVDFSEALEVLRDETMVDKRLVSTEGASSSSLNMCVRICQELQLENAPVAPTKPGSQPYPAPQLVTVAMSKSSLYRITFVLVPARFSPNRS